jgi:succinate dehydrogenase / fumarate reductase membrane anchor subunit
MSLESPLGKFLGHGSAKSGTEHWLSQRVSAVALVPLAIWFVVALLGMGSFAHADVVAWMSQPLHAILLILLVVTLLYHSQLGVQVVVEDYVRTGWLNVLTLMVAKFAHVVAGVACIYSIVILSVGTVPGTAQ